jgi:hypothetical protein
MRFWRFELDFLRFGDFAGNPEGGEVLGGGCVDCFPVLVAAAVCQVLKLGFVQFQFAFGAFAVASLHVLFDCDFAVSASYDSFSPFCSAWSRAQTSLHSLELLYISRLFLGVFDVSLLAIFNPPLLRCFFQTFQFLVLCQQIADSAFTAEKVAVAGTWDWISGGQEA